MLAKIVAKIVLEIPRILAVAKIGGIATIPVYFLWNWIMPELFAFKAITIWQAWGLVLLVNVLGVSVKKSYSTYLQE